MQNPYRIDLGNEDLFPKWNFKNFVSGFVPYALRLKPCALCVKHYCRGIEAEYNLSPVKLITVTCS
jgi:hypothetical protein